MKKKMSIGLVHGVFDVVHHGHILHFKEAKKKVDYLICSVTSDNFVNKGPNKPLFKISERVEFLENLKFFDKVITSNDLTAVKNIMKYKPHYYFKGIEYKKTVLKDQNLKKEIKALKNNQGQIIFTNTKASSSSKIINHDFGFLSKSTISQIKKLKNDVKKFKQNKFINMSSYNILIGENIIDKYLFTQISGKSNKSPIVSTLKKNEIGYAGGILVVANFFAEFVNRISLLSFSGKDYTATIKKYLSKKVKQLKVNIFNYPIIKTRILDHYSKNKLFQITENEDYKFEKSSINKVVNFIQKKAPSYENIIFFNYGYQLTDKKILDCLKKYKSKILINFQTNSYNYGFNLLNKFPSAKFASMDELEFRLAVGDKHTNMEELIRKKINILNNYKTSVVTCGKNGAYLIEKKKIKHFEPIYKNLIDTTGCGDIFMTTFIIYKYFYKFSSEFSMIVSHIAAGIHGNELGNNLNLDRDKLNKIITKIINV